MSWELVLLIAAGVLFLLAALGVKYKNYQFGWAGMFFVALYFAFASNILPPS